MGHCGIYYKELLQCLAANLQNGKDLNNGWLHEDSIEKLEAFVLEQKELLTRKNFYYTVGRACQNILNKTRMLQEYKEFNGFLNGLCKFEQFVGLRTTDGNFED